MPQELVVSVPETSSILPLLSVRNSAVPAASRSYTQNWVFASSSLDLSPALETKAAAAVEEQPE